MKELLHVGLDIGSTTVKIVILNKNLETIYSNYERHFSDTKSTLYNVLEKMLKDFGGNDFTISLTGSGALDISKILGVNFIQEVISCKSAVEKIIPQTDVVIELGGEDAKIIYFDKFIEQRMNGTCAGGTGAFLDQMSSLLNTDTAGLNELAKTYETIYPIASRCGVFAKTDIQPLLNEGARKEDIAASIFQAVVNQTISGLACGRPIKGRVAFLGGPLNYLSELRKRFIETLKLTDDKIIVPENAHLLVATGAALSSLDSTVYSTEELKEKLKNFKSAKYTEGKTLPPLFETPEIQATTPEATSVMNVFKHCESVSLDSDGIIDKDLFKDCFMIQKQIVENEHPGAFDFMKNGWSLFITVAGLFLLYYYVLSPRIDKLIPAGKVKLPLAHGEGADLSTGEEFDIGDWTYKLGAKAWRAPRKWWDGGIQKLKDSGFIK